MSRALTHDHYKVLGVGREATPAQIRAAFLRRAKQWHPDRNPSPRATEAFQLLNRAYATLRDPDARSRFDRQLDLCRPSRPMYGHPRDIAARMRSRASFGTREEGHRHWAYVGLHLTGILFSTVLFTGTVTGIALNGWPAYLLVFSLPGLTVVPESWNAIRSK
ncbi:MAG: J domain-containing protein [Flavobacteriales bacterium]|nr:J domain-containing protein [Flavobacteriales bacterium]MCB9168016.1 J domain-containing protein [Flavobacteriales bacterium]